MDRDKLFNPRYGNLSKEERERVLLSLRKIDSRFAWVGLERFEKFGMATDTALFTFEGKEFVFVPGGAVTLGWNEFSVGMDDATHEEIKELLAEMEITLEVDAFLRDCMSPVRTVNIEPMLVERRLNEIGWCEVAINSPEVTRHNDTIKKHFHGTGMLEISGHMRIFSGENGVPQAQKYEPVSYKDFVSGLHNDKFALPTEDEWEYLCGGGSRTLFRWGDSFDFDMKLRHFEYEEYKDLPYHLELPNQFGLSIAYDPYKYEVVEDSQYFLKGGDGGCSICGGLGMLLGYLPVATYYRMYSMDDDSLNYQNDIGGSYTFYRRIVRL